MGEPGRGLEQLLPQQAQGDNSGQAGRDRLLAEFLEGGGRRGFSFGTPSNQEAFNNTQSWLNGNAAASAGLIQLRMTPWFEQANVRSSLAQQFQELDALERSASEQRRTPAVMLPRRTSTIQCHQPQQRFELPEPSPYRVLDLLPPRPTQDIVNAIAARAHQIGSENLNRADLVAFQTAVNALAGRTGVSLEDRTNILSSLCVLMSPGANRPLPDTACRCLALGLAQALGHPPAGATGDLQLAQSNPRQLAEYVRNMAVCGRAQHSSGGQRELAASARQEVSDAQTPQQTLDRLLGSTRAVIPPTLEIDLRRLDQPGAANFPLSDEVRNLLRQIHDADDHLQTLRVTHLANGDDLIQIALDAQRTEGEGVTAITFAQSLQMTVHRNANGSINLTNIRGISTPLANPSELRLGVPGGANRRIVAVTWAQNRDITDEIGEAQITQFDQMIRILDDVNRQRQR